MMIEEAHGDLFAADVDALVNAVNTVGVMGKGIALQFKRAYPANFRAYRSACQRGAVRLGEMFVFDIGFIGSRRFIINFPTKRHWRDNSQLRDVENGLEALARTITEHHLRSLAVPALGCGNGGLAWADVRPLIYRMADALPEVRVVVFPPEGASAPSVMPTTTACPRQDRGPLPDRAG